jgi:hypothetical protein
MKPETLDHHWWLGIWQWHGKKGNINSGTQSRQPCAGKSPGKWTCLLQFLFFTLRTLKLQNASTSNTHTRQHSSTTSTTQQPPPQILMPRSSERADRIKNLRRCLRLHINQAAFEAWYGNDTDDESSNSKIKGLVIALISIKKKCYLAERVRLERAPDITEFLFCLDTYRFKQEFRMSLALFHELLTLIQDHPIFHNNLNASQRPVRDQLMVTLRQMGMFGNGALVGILACFFSLCDAKG